MYPVSDAYLEQLATNAVEVNWYGSIKATNGVVYSIDPSIIVEGSGKITREICSGEDIEIGTTCAAELDLSLYLENVNRYELYKGTVEIYFQLKLPNSEWETVPCGKFFIAEPPERTLDVITIHAYDAMLNFNREFSTVLTGSPYALITYACNACGVELGTTQEAIANYVNGTVETYTYQDIAVYTYRDLLGYIASYLCCYAYIGVDGKLYLEPYTMDVVRTISDDWRYSYKPKDYEAFYTVISSYFAVSQETEKVILSPNGLTYEMGANPLIQFNDDSVRKSVLTNIITALSTVSYTPFTASVPCDPSLMVGDVLNFTGNHAVDGKYSAITKMVININGSMELTCVGSDPNLNVLTNVEKQISTAARNSNKDGMYYYDYANAAEIHLDDGESATVIEFGYTTTKETHIDFHAEIKCHVSTTETYDSNTDTYSENDGKVFVTYRSGGDIVTEYYPVDTFFDGTHLLHLLYAWWASANIVSTFEVEIKVVGCSVTIDAGASRGYIAGIGLVGDGAWDGSVRIEETFTPYNFGRIHKNFTDTVETDVETPDDDTVIQFVPKVNFFQRIVKNFESSVNAKSLHRFTVLYNANEMTISNIVTENGVWKNEYTALDGYVQTPDCVVDSVLKVTSKRTSNTGDVTYIVSFDGGSTWYTYASGWILYESGYGMIASDMANIPADAWNSMITNNTIMVRATLQADATLTDIQIYTAEYGDYKTIEFDELSSYDNVHVRKGFDRVELIYDYEYVSTEQTVDEGRMCGVGVDTTQFSEFNTVEVNKNG